MTSGNRGHRFYPVIGLALGVIAVTSSTTSAQNFSEKMLAAHAESVVRVRVNGEGQRSIASGFVWRRSMWVVTALHAVAGMDEIEVEYRSGSRRLARIARVLQDSDLALLELEEPLPIDPLQSATDVESGDAVMLLGYVLDRPQIVDIELRVRFAQGRLQDIVPSSVHREIERNGFPSLSLNVMDLQGPALPGSSGAPVLDDDGKVVAILDGGLEAGAKSFSWGIPSSSLVQLEHSDEEEPRVRGSQRSLFASDFDREDGVESIRIGNRRLTLVRTRTLEQLRFRTDDPVGLDQIETYFHTVGVDVDEDTEFDVYVDETSGATIVVPKGMELKKTDNELIAEDASGQRYHVELHTITRIGPGQLSGEAQDISIEFERRIDRAINVSVERWVNDPNWTYATPRETLGGVLVRRRAYRRVASTAFGFQNTGAAFVTFANWHETFLIVAALWTPTVASSNSRNMNLWGQIVLAAHLSGGPR